MNKKESMLDAFLRQSKIDPKSILQSEEAEKAFGDGDRKQGYIEDMLDKKAMLDAMKGMTSQEISVRKNIPIPSKIKDGELDETAVAHDLLKVYDHSLEQNRWKKIGGNYDPIEIDPIDM